jgi:hypothetical protein
MESLKLPTVNDLRKEPKDTILEAVILTVELKTWREIIPADSQEKFVKNSTKKEESVLDEKQIVIKYSYKFNDLEYFGTIKLTYSENPSAKSNLGKFLIKYGELTPGRQFKLRFDEESNSKLQ